jgi:hypothetical protein
MPLLIFLLVIVALAALGVLGFVLKVALGVAIGVFLAIVGVAAYAMWRVRRAWRRAVARVGPPAGGARPGAVPPGGRSAPLQGRSEVTVLRPDASRSDAGAQPPGSF